MENKFITYKDIFDGDQNVPENLDKGLHDIDIHTNKDLVLLFQIRNISNTTKSFIEVQENTIASLESKLHYSYNEFGERDDTECKQQHSKNVLENGLFSTRTR